MKTIVRLDEPLLESELVIVVKNGKAEVVKDKWGETGPVSLAEAQRLLSKAIDPVT